MLLRESVWSQVSPNMEIKSLMCLTLWDTSLLSLVGLNEWDERCDQVQYKSSS